MTMSLERASQIVFESERDEISAWDTQHFIDGLRTAAANTRVNAADRAVYAVAADRLSALYYGETEPRPRVDPDVLLRIRIELAFAEGKKYVAVPIDIADLKALLAAVGGEA